MIAGVLLLFLLQSCATMLAGTDERVQFWTENRKLEGVTVIVGSEQHQVPGTVDVPKRTETVTFLHPDYDPIVVELNRDFRFGMLISDILFTPGFGLVGIIVDSITEAWYRLPATVRVSLADSRVLQGGRISGGSVVSRTKSGSTDGHDEWAHE